MNLVCIPYHDWRKIEAEGSRTRDSHLVRHFMSNKAIHNLIIVNRPTSLPELLINKKKLEINGTVILKKGGLKLYKISEKAFVIDYITTDIITPVTEKRLWALRSFGYRELFDFFQESTRLLSITDFQIFSNNIFSYSFLRKFPKENVVFDAYDNLIFFPNNRKIVDKLVVLYNELVSATRCWTTNSTKNVDYYKKNYNQHNCFLVKNGVDLELFTKEYAVPSDLVQVRKPRIGFGGKVTHLFDYDLFNYCVANHPDKSFVIVGQILDKLVFSKISKAPNVYYLGDKQYGQYPSYVCNFDVGIVPYVTNHLESGVDSIKVYEYIAAGLSSVGTTGGGMPDVKDFIFIANDKEQFSACITKALEKKEKAILPSTHTWKYKTDNILDLVFKSL